MLDATLNSNRDWAAALSATSGVRRQAVREELVSMGESAVSVLARLLGNPRKQVRWEAALALKTLALPSAVPALVHALKDEDGDVRWVVAEALAAIGSPSVLPLLRSLIRDADAFELREAAHVAIHFLEDAGMRALLDPLYLALRRGAPPDVVMVLAGEAMEGLSGG